MILGGRLPRKVRHWRRVSLRLRLRVLMMLRITRVPWRVPPRGEVEAEADGEEEAVVLLRLRRTTPVPLRITLRISRATMPLLQPSVVVAVAGEIMSSTVGN